MYRNYLYSPVYHFVERSSHSFWGWDGWTALSVIVLAVTLYFLIRYTRATGKITEHQMMPAVDFNMIYDKDVKKTYFWFWNSSDIPAKVSLKIVTKTKEYNYDPLRIPPNKLPLVHLLKTAPHYDFLENGEVDGYEVEVHTTVIPALDNNRLKLKFTKSYRFNKTNSEWDESSWGYPDPPFPG